MSRWLSRTLIFKYGISTHFDSCRRGSFGMLCVLGFGVVVHVMLHWAWVCGVVVRKLLHRKELPDDGIQTVYGVGLLITLLLTAATVIGFAMLSIQMPPQ